MSVVLRCHEVEGPLAWPIIHPTANVSPSAQIGAGTKIWHRAHVREGANIGANCNIGKDVYIDFGVQIGDNVKIQNSALIYHGAKIEDGVFIGPQVCLTNDRIPRAITPSGALKTAEDWIVTETRVRYGASLGAGAIILAGMEIGRFAMVGAGAVVTHHVPEYGLVVGVPASLIGYVCPCGHRLLLDGSVGRCTVCGTVVHLKGVST
jgi:UDP-2-acetamido-3-amino-2,3-dideoxy-glucuronate N-acetyltransferase